MAAKKLHILFWNEPYLPVIGGVEMFTARLSEALVRRGHRVTVIADHIPSTASEFEVLDGVPVYRLPFRHALQSMADSNAEGFRKFAEITQQIKSLKQDLQPDIVHVNFTGPAPLFHFRTLSASPSRTVVTFQVPLSDQSISLKGLVPTILNKADSIVAVSAAAARNIEQHTGFPSDRISIVFPGVPDELFVAKPATTAATPTMVFLGRLVHNKGVDTVIRALPLMTQKARLTVIGDGPERAALETLVHEQGLQDIVNFTGFVDDAATRRDMLAAAHVMAVPSRQEPFGMVAVEGALAALPVVAARSGGLPEVVSDGQTGIIVSPEDPMAWAQALDSILADAELAARMGKNGRERALREFSLSKTADCYERIYSDALDGVRG